MRVSVLCFALLALMTPQLISCYVNPLVEPDASVNYQVQVGKPFTFTLQKMGNNGVDTSYNGGLTASQAIGISSANWNIGASTTFSNGIAHLTLTFTKTASGVVVKFLAADGDYGWSCRFAVVATGSGDPQFSGLQGQDFQVHGRPDTLFNLVSWPSHGYSLNSRFVYLSHGKCDYNNTVCWSHPGTYLGQLGFLLSNSTRVLINSGNHQQGLSVSIDDVPVHNRIGDSQVIVPSTSEDSSVEVINNDVVIISNPAFTVRVTNADLFVNIDVTMHDQELLKEGSVKHVFKPKQKVETSSLASGQTLSATVHDCPSTVYGTSDLHGLVGSTYRNAVFVTKEGEERQYEGDVDDYSVQSFYDFLSMDAFNHLHTQ